MGNYNAAHIKALVRKSLNKAENIHIISNAEVRTYFVLLNISGADGDHNLGLVGQLQQHAEFTVGRKAGQNPGSVKIIKEFSAKFQIKLISELINTFPDVIRLHLQIFVIVKTLSLIHI